MNERIKDLLKQATRELNPDDREWVFFEVDQAKFAELIVRECCQKLENDGMVEVAMEMKEHFGVEE